MTDWTDNQHALRRHLKTDKLSNLLRWSTVEKTMFVGDVDFIHKEYDYLCTAYKYNHLVKLIKETSVGNPKTLYGWTSGNLIHQLYHLQQWLDRSPSTSSGRSKQDISQLSTIFEIGAGYGAMALICRRLGFKGQYYIEDLPELKQVQGYYLHNTIGLDNIIWRVPETCDLLIACHSLGEMAVKEREALLARVEADGYLFASSYEFGNVDNQAWFMQFAESRPGIEWEFYLHPFQENAFYLVGTRL